MRYDSDVDELRARHYRWWAIGVSWSHVKLGPVSVAWCDGEVSVHVLLRWSWFWRWAA